MFCTGRWWHSMPAKAALRTASSEIFTTFNGRRHNSTETLRDTDLLGLLYSRFSALKKLYCCTLPVGNVMFFTVLKQKYFTIVVWLVLVHSRNFILQDLSEQVGIKVSGHSVAMFNKVLIDRFSSTVKLLLSYTTTKSNSMAATGKCIGNLL